MEKPKDYHISSFREKSSKYSTVNLFLQHYFHQTLSKIWVLPWLHVSTWLILFSGLLSPFQFSLLGPQQSFHHSNANQVCLSVYTFTKYILESSFTQDFFILGSILGNHYRIKLKSQRIPSGWITLFIPDGKFLVSIWPQILKPFSEIDL